MIPRLPLLLSSETVGRRCCSVSLDRFRRNLCAFCFSSDYYRPLAFVPNSTIEGMSHSYISSLTLLIAISFH